MLWAGVLNDTLEIFFAHPSFKWTNNAKDKAAVVCIIVGIRNISKAPKWLYDGIHCQNVKNINPYLANADSTFVYKRTKPLSNLPLMVLGNMPYDRGLLHFSIQEYNELTYNQPAAKKYLRKIVGSDEYINGYHRYCLWISDAELEAALKIPFLKDRIESNKQTRLESIDIGVRKLAAKPHQFREMRMAMSNALILPGTSSEI